MENTSEIAAMIKDTPMYPNKAMHLRMIGRYSNASINHSFIIKDLINTNGKTYDSKDQSTIKRNLQGNYSILCSISIQQAIP